MKTRGINIEIFSCAGGMAEGFRRAGVHFDFAFDFTRDHCDSYEANIGHRPVCMDVRDLLRMAKGGMVGGPVDLLVGDPPCTPWSRAGKRMGTEDERDMIEDTCELIRILRPRAYLIGNVPGLDDSKNWHIVQRVIGGLQKYGYCVADFAALDAVNYGTPQRRTRPFWFGHLDGPCIQWPKPTHCERSELATETLPGFERLQPWITCREAFTAAGLADSELGRPVKLRKRSQNSNQHGSVPDKPARVVGTSNLSDGNVLLFNTHHPPNDPDAPSRTIGAKSRGNGPQSMLTRHDVPDRNHDADQPARSITTQHRWANNGSLVYDLHHPPGDIDKPSNVVRAGSGGGATRTVRTSSKHPPSEIDDPAMTVKASDGGGSKRAMRTGKPRARDTGRPGQGMRVGKPDVPSKTITGKAARVGAGESHVLEWPWDVPATTVQADNRIAPPGHHDENWNDGLLSQEGAIVLSEVAATVLQGFPKDWKFLGKTQKARWSQIGQAMPPPLSHAVATSVVAQRKAADAVLDNPDTEIASSLATGKLTVV